jgi:hypothetical protein
VLSIGLPSLPIWIRKTRPNREIDYVTGFLGLSPACSLLYTILIAIVGAVILVFFFRLITLRRA